MCDRPWVWNDPTDLCDGHLIWHCLCWCGGYFNQSNETSRAHLQLDLALDVLSLYMRDLMRHRGDIWDCLDDCQAVWWQTYPARQLIPKFPRFCRCVEETKQLGKRACRTKEARKLEYQSRKRSPPWKVRVDRSKIDTRLRKTLHVAHVSCLFIGCLKDNNGWRTHKFDDLEASPSLLEVRYK